MNVGGPAAVDGVGFPNSSAAPPVPPATATTATTSSPACRRGTAARRGGVAVPWSRRSAVVVVSGQAPGLLATLRADSSPGEVIGLDMDPAEEPRLAGLVGGVKVRRPLEPDIRGGALLELQRAGLDRVAADAAREVLPPPQHAHHL